METSFSRQDFLFDGKTVRSIVNAGQTKNIDFKITGAAGRKVNGGFLFAIDAAFGDEVTCQVCDVDNILGYGPETTLNEYLTWSIDPRGTIEIEINYAGTIPPGIYIRCIYKSCGQQDVKVAINHKLHREL